jgi:catechol 2,3-dioxygenase-like lactoylglutathione lyase family enzyme
MPLGGWMGDIRMAPGCGITGIDHSLIGVRDLEAAQTVWGRLGFTVTPRGRHIGWGTGNYCIMLDSGYIELLGIIDASQFTNNLDQFLAQREGLMGVAFATDDALACQDALTTAGLHPDGPKALARLLELPEGDVTPRFNLVFLPPEETPAVRAFVCHHATPELVRRPAWQQHANGATALISVTVVCDDPVSTAFGYLRIFGPERLKVLDGVTIVNCGLGTLRFVTPGRLATLHPGLDPLPAYPTPWMAAMKLEVQDRKRCLTLLREAGVKLTVTAEGCLVHPDDANGLILELVGR